MCPLPPQKEQVLGISPPDYQTIQLPPSHILAHLTDAHCHPTDLSPPVEAFNDVRLGGLAAMAVNADQEVVKALGAARGWRDTDQGHARTAKVVQCFGYHPWYTHRYSLASPLPPKREHYEHVFALKPATQNKKAAKLQAELDVLLPSLPEPEAWAPRLAQVRADIEAARARGMISMVGEIGLDATARVRLYQPWIPREEEEDVGKVTTESQSEKPNELEHDSSTATTQSPAKPKPYFTPFKTSLSHQLAICCAQLSLAIDLGVSASLHCVNASGATLDLLTSLRQQVGGAAFGRINIDVHSCGGMAPEFLIQAARSFPNLYFSPSVLLTPRSGGADAVRAIPRDRILVESDIHDVALCDRLVWAAVVWVAKCRGWKVEGWKEETTGSADVVGEATPQPINTDSTTLSLNGQAASQSIANSVSFQATDPDGDGDQEDDWELEEEEELFDARGRPLTPPETAVWAVRTLERNWARFVGLLE